MQADHLDHELLSDLVDGSDAASGPGAAHLAACETCTERLRGMRAAAALFATPVAPLAPDVVDAMLERAVAAPVLPLTTRRKGASGGQWVAAVAAVVALLVGLPFLLRASSDSTGSGDSLATRSALEDSSADNAMTANDADAGAPAAGGGAAAGTEAAPLSQARTAAGARSGAGASGGTRLADLGAADDPDELVSLVRARMSTGEPARDEYAEDKSGGGDDGGDGTGTVRCEDQARRAGAGRVGARQYAALVQWKGAAAEVLVFDLTEPAQGLTRQAYVMARDGCAVLADPRF